jgi:hypothetical protein
MAGDEVGRIRHRLWLTQADSSSPSTPRRGAAPVFFPPGERRQMDGPIARFELRPHSQRSTTIGSTRVARRAGT